MVTTTTSTSDVNISHCPKHYLTLEPNVQPPTIITSSLTPPSVSPLALKNLPLPGTSPSAGSSPVGTPNTSVSPSHPSLTTRRDSTTQVILIITDVFCFKRKIILYTLFFFNSVTSRRKKHHRTN